MLIQTFFQDLRIGLRVLIKEKSFCTLAVTVLAVGIGAVTSMFSVVNGTMLRGFSFPNADRLAGVQVVDPTQSNPFGFNSQIFSLDYEAMREQQTSFEMMAAFINGATVNVTADGTPKRYTGAYVSADFFRILGVRPVIGRDFAPRDDQPGAEKITLISYQLWQRDFGGSPEVIGRSIRINGKPATIVGVMPQGFAFPVNEELWIPLYAEYPPTPRNSPNAQGNQPGVLALLKPGVSFDQAQAEFSGLAKQLAAAFPDTNKKFDTAVIQPLIKTFTPPNIKGLLWTMLGFCVGLLLIACVNVMNMQFARATLRAKELAIRSSLGATRIRLIRQMLTESLLVAALGATVGIGLASWATGYLNAATHSGENPIPAYIVFNIDVPVLVFVVSATMLAALVSGFVPAWMSSRASAVDALKESGRGNTSRAVTVITRSLVVMQILVSSLLLVGALLQLKSILRQNQIAWGYDNGAILSARLALMEGDYPTPEARKLFFDRLLRELRANPEYEGAALTNRFRMTFSGFGRIEIDGRAYAKDEDRPNTNFEQVSEGYFETLKARIIEGRDFALDDTDAKQPIAIVNAAFAHKHFGNESALGRRFRTVGNNGQLFGPWRTIVGVVSNVRMLGPFNNPQVDDTGFYVPYFSSVFGPALPGPVQQQFATVIVRPRANNAADIERRAAVLATTLQREVNKVDANLPLYFVGTARVNQESFLGVNRIIASMFTLFGGIAVLLSSVGLYGVMSFSVNQRMQEFGIRMALGADTQRILQMVLRQGGVQLLIGLGAGLALTATVAVLARDGIATQLFEISPLDPLTYTTVALLLTAVAFVATLVPAQRATRVDPMTALRAE
ncbi:ABC transporter permease [Opitutus terrae]|uniref:Permease n=1 Tax=Opitutus terrae (strain DSM 11246 / JCM 15787 / PB90-1) TaxID=452637 RepID=B1ZXX1_OPITP|nr:ABC transporter permease [Opitutus terrae]ACB75173.1 permease [Opitutus terrae PB90-1]